MILEKDTYIVELLAPSAKNECECLLRRFGQSGNCRKRRLHGRSIRDPSTVSVLSTSHGRPINRTIVGFALMIGDFTASCLRGESRRFEAQLR